MRYRMQMTPAQMNLLDSHDVSRFLSLCGGDMRRYRLAILFMMTFVGMPTVFYGDELGVQGLSEEEYRCPMPWDNENSTLCTFSRKPSPCAKTGTASLWRFPRGICRARKRTNHLRKGILQSACYHLYQSRRQSR